MLDDFVLARKFLKDVFRRCVLAGFGFLGFRIQLKFFEQDFAELLWGIDIKFFSGKFKYFSFQLSQVVFQVDAFLGPRPARERRRLG